MPLTFSDPLRDTIRTRLESFPRYVSQRDDLRRAAVCLALTDMPDGGAGLVLTFRAARMSSHSNQFALPGGRIDPGETEVEAARREMDEELGYLLPEESLLGLLDDYETRSGYIITPVVFWAEPGISGGFVPNPGEVAKVFTVSLGELTDPELLSFVTIPESDRPVIRISLVESYIHAPTAALMHQLGELVCGRETRVNDYEEPVFAWR
ncbi:CoA pyrophosphatase [Pseudooceanicola sp.]|uniref:NUDIX hydrolase n=1 Tax=Pseudooceanicola sp. TaxID=1914328 RepID=UPI002604D55C|nr:CoA pyrophosphatase [Pseudooceanicola sp.]MDF1854550.1 CoA pyrophosphatase [Pseudooceanicola sp.]